MAVKGHLRSLISIPTGSGLDFLWVINNNVGSVLHRFRDGGLKVENHQFALNSYIYARWVTPFDFRDELDFGKETTS